MNIFYILIILAVVAVVVAVCFNPDRCSRSDASRRSNVDYKPRELRDNLCEAILSLINDRYSPFYEAKLSDHIYSDLDIDSLDIVDLLFDISQIADTKISASNLYREYGRNPTVSQLIAYVRRCMQDPKPTE